MRRRGTAQTRWKSEQIIRTTSLGTRGTCFFTQDKPNTALNASCWGIGKALRERPVYNAETHGIFPCQLAEIDTILGTLESQSISSVDAVLGNFGTKKIASGNRAKIS